MEIPVTITDKTIEEFLIIDAVRGGRSHAHNSKQLQYNIDYAERLEAHVSDYIISQVRSHILRITNPPFKCLPKPTSN